MHRDVENAVSAINTDIERKMHRDVENAVSAINTDIERKTWLAHILEERIRTTNAQESTLEKSSGVAEINYLSFENQFRGSREDISERQKKFIRYFTSCNNVIDIGCGRGEFLELMREQGVGSRGIDIDQDMVEFCRLKGLEVEMADAVTYLEYLKDQSLDGIFIDQVVEHLEPAYLVKMLGLCYQKMREGHYIVIETVNPLSFASLANFYIDMTHKHPVHPETLKYLMSFAGFKDIEVQFFSPFPDEARLQHIPNEKSDDLEKRENIVCYNRNIDILNSVLFGPQDYTIIGKK
jgi:O-antigen chain-terminating methyltransferase